MEAQTLTNLLAGYLPNFPTAQLEATNTLELAFYYGTREGELRVALYIKTCLYSCIISGWCRLGKEGLDGSC